MNRIIIQGSKMINEICILMFHRIKALRALFRYLHAVMFTLVIVSDCSAHGSVVVYESITAVP